MIIQIVNSLLRLLQQTISQGTANTYGCYILKLTQISNTGLNRCATRMHFNFKTKKKIFESPHMKAKIPLLCFDSVRYN